MKKFLNIVAEDLYNKFGKDNNILPKIAVIFPNNRARLFFGEELFKVANKPTWSPSFLSINDIFASKQELTLAEPVTLNTILYRTYTDVFKERYPDKTLETHDEFYLWGEILLHDFDDIDKNLVDSKRLFANIKNQEDLTNTLDFLTDEQKEHIKLFFKNFNPENETELKNKFIENWNILYEVYTNFKENLEKKELVYEGMLKRKAIENIDKNGFNNPDYKKYVFVGFNVLDKCETKLFDKLKNLDLALFYWDYDKIYMNKSHEAGRFILSNIAKFPNELSETYFDNFKKDKDIQFISASSENAQARYIKEWLENKMKEKDFNANETAIILCDESLLTSVIHSIPNEIKYINVTMGFPLSQTQIASLIKAIFTIHLNSKSTKDNKESFYYKDVISILQHSLILDATNNLTKEIINCIIKSHKFYIDDKDINKFTEEAKEGITKGATEEITKSIKDNINNGNIDLKKIDYENIKRLLSFLFKNNIASSGILDILTNVIDIIAKDKCIKIDKENKEGNNVKDPLKEESLFRVYTLINEIKTEITNKQENENIDLKLSTLSGIIDKAIMTTKVPYSGEPIRGLQIMGMLETRNLDFKNILMLSTNEGIIPRKDANDSFIPFNLKKGFDMPTFEHQDSIYAYYFYRILQRAENITLMYNSATEGTNAGEMSRFMLQLLIESGQNIENYNLTSSINLDKSDEIKITKTDEIIKKLDEIKILSPSALNKYLNCQLSFFFRYICKYKEQDEMEDEISNRIIGNIFHHSAQYIYYDIIMSKSGKPHSILNCDSKDLMNDFNKNLKNNSLNKNITKKDLEKWIGAKIELKADNTQKESATKDARAEVNTDSNSDAIKSTPPPIKVLTKAPTHSIHDVVEFYLLKDYFNVDFEYIKENNSNANIKCLIKLAKNARNIVYNGEQVVKLNLIYSFIKRLLEIDLKYTPFTIEGLEVYTSSLINFTANNISRTIKTGGYIDRLDSKDGTVRVLDYKTGKIMDNFKDIESLFVQLLDRNKNAFQAILYSKLIKDRYSKDTPIKPALLFIQKATNADYKADIKIGKGRQKTNIEDVTDCKYNKFDEELKQLLSDIYNKEIPFTQCKEIEHCTYCPYKSICGK